MDHRARILGKRKGAALVALLAAGTIGWAAGNDSNREFSRYVIDLGVVVGDVEKSADFYKNAIGFTEVKGFDVPASMGRDSGLSDNKPFHVRVFVLGDEKNATRLKLMQFSGAAGKRVDNSYIHSSLGFSYLTIWVNDTTAAMKRLTEAGAKPIAKGPVPLPKGFPEGIFLTLVRDPDGNMIELVGPKK